MEMYKLKLQRTNSFHGLKTIRSVSARQFFYFSVNALLMYKHFFECSCSVYNLPFSNGVIGCDLLILTPRTISTIIAQKRVPQSRVFMVEGWRQTRWPTLTDNSPYLYTFLSNSFTHGPRWNVNLYKGMSGRHHKLKIVSNLGRGLSKFCHEKFRLFKKNPPIKQSFHKVIITQYSPVPCSFFPHFTVVVHFNLITLILTHAEKNRTALLQF